MTICMSMLVYLLLMALMAILCVSNYLNKLAFTFSFIYMDLFQKLNLVGNDGPSITNNCVYKTARKNDIEKYSDFSCWILSIRLYSLVTAY